MDNSTTSNAPSEPRHDKPPYALLVEDNFIIALDAEDMLRQLGVESVQTAGSVARALELIAIAPPDFALLNVNLGDAKCYEVAVRLRDLGVPFAFATGYHDIHALPADFADTLIVPKPYNLNDVERAMSVIKRLA